MRTAVAISVAALFGLTGCQLPGRACTDQLVMGVRVSLVDSTTNSAVPGNDVLVFATDGAYTDTAFTNTFPDVPFSVVKDRPGNYTVTVLAPGYQRWERSDVRVTADECHVRPVFLTARLQELPS